MAKKKKKKDTITKEDLLKIEKTVVREEQKEQGFFDGRFNTRADEDKTKYKRKPKHKNQSEDEV